MTVQSEQQQSPHACLSPICCGEDLPEVLFQMPNRSGTIKVTCSLTLAHAVHSSFLLTWTRMLACLYRCAACLVQQLFQNPAVGLMLPSGANCAKENVFSLFFLECCLNKFKGAALGGSRTSTVSTCPSRGWEWSYWEGAVSITIKARTWSFFQESDAFSAFKKLQITKRHFPRKQAIVSERCRNSRVSSSALRHAEGRTRLL